MELNPTSDEDPTHYTRPQLERPNSEKYTYAQVQKTPSGSKARCIGSNTCLAPLLSGLGRILTKAISTAPLQNLFVVRRRVVT